jgi:hypothetical protein
LAESVSVPEPGTVFVSSLGLAALGLVRRGRPAQILAPLRGTSGRPSPTLADLEGAPNVRRIHIAEALAWRRAAHAW